MKCLKFTLLIQLLCIFMVASCIPSKTDVDIRKAKHSLLAAQVSQVQIKNNRIILIGSNLTSITNFKIDGYAQSFRIISNTGSQLIAEPTSYIALKLDAIMNLVIGSASASTVIPVQFDLDVPGAQANDFLQYNGRHWESRSINGLSYKGTWSASGAAPDSSPAPGDYYIVRTNGSFVLDGISSWTKGDWAVYADAITGWQKIDNSTGTFNLESLGNVQISTPATNEVLSWNGTKWVNQAFAAPNEVDPKVGAVTATKWCRGDGVKVVCDQNAPTATELDPTVKAFAKANLPTCSAGQVLSGNGTSLSCVTDATGAGSFTGTPNYVVMTDGSGALSVSGITTTVFNYLSGATSNIQTQLNAKANSASIVDWSAAGAQVIHPDHLNMGLGQGGKALVTDSSAQIVTSPTTAIEIGYLSGVTGNVQTQIDSIASGTGPWTVAGNDVTRVTGNIGIGTASPDVASKFVIANGTNQQGLEFQPGAANRILSYDRNAGAYLPLVLDASNITLSKFVGIGAAPTRFFDVMPNTAANQAILRVGAAGYNNGFTIHQDGSQNLVYSFDGGNVGIGATSPTEKLQVAGTIHSSTGGFKFPDGTTQTTAATGATAETDPTVKAFAKATLPTCSAGQVLSGNGTSLSCVTDATGAGSFTGTPNYVVVTDGTGALSASGITTTVFNYLSGATSNIQTQLNGKANSASIVDWSTAGAEVIHPDHLNMGLGEGGKALVTDSSAQVVTSTTTATEIGYLSGATSNIQTQIDSIASGTGPWTLASGNVSRASGKVGIGIGSPAATLDVIGVDMHFGSAVDKGLRISDYGGVTYLQSGDGTGGTQPISLGPWWSSISYFYMGTTGNIGIGNTSPAAKLQVSGVIHSDTGGFKFPDGTTQTTAATGATAETDPTVKAFAKATLPTCSAGQVLSGDGTNLTCVTDVTGAGAFTGTANSVAVTDGSGNLSVSGITTTVLNYLTGVTSNIQTQLNAKANSASMVDWSAPGTSQIIHTDHLNMGLGNAGKVLVSDPTTAQVVPSSITTTQLGYLNGVTSSIQTQINSLSGGSATMGGDLTGTASNAQIAAGAIVDADINSGAAIAQSKISGLTTALAARENTITAGTTAQYWRGDKTWQSLSADVLGTVLTGLTTTAGTVTASDTVLSSIGKIVGNQGNYVLKTGSTMSGALAMGTNNITGLATPTASDHAATKGYVDSKASQWTTNGSNIYYNTGSVGIGTTTPNSALDVVGGISATAQINATFATANNSSGGVNVLKRGTTGDATASVVSGAELGYNGFYGWDGAAYGRGAFVLAKTTEAWSSTGHGTYYSIWTTPTGSVTNAERLRIDQNGNVGIGTTTPAAPFHLSPTITGAAPASSGTTPSTGIVARLSNAGGATLDHGMLSGGTQWLQATNTGNQATSYILALNPNGGNVGVGTLTPTAKIETQGLGNGTNGLLYLNSTSSSAKGTLARIGQYSYWNMDSSGNTFWSWGARYDGEAAQWVRAYTSNPNYLPYIKYGTAGTITIGGAASSLTTDTNPTLTDKFTFDTSNGNFTTTGQVKITGGTPGLGKVLTSDATGLATWSAPATGGTVTDITAGTGLTGGTISTSGTIGLGTELAAVNGISTTGFVKRTGAGAYSTATAIALASDVSGTLPIGNGGTNATTATAALTNLLPTQTSNSGKVLQTNGTSASWVTPSAGTVTGVTATSPLAVTGTTAPIVAIANGSATGQTLRWGGSSWSATKLDYKDLLNTTSVSPWPSTSCGAGEALIWTSVSDSFICSAITVSTSNFGTQTKSTFLAASSITDSTPTFRKISGYDLPETLIIGPTHDFLISTGVGTGTNNFAASNYQSLTNLTTGSSNIAIGYQALGAATTANSNVSIGIRSMRDATSANSTVAIGENAFMMSQGDYNVALGRDSMVALTGNGNIGLGYNTLNSTTGNYNIAIGYNTQVITPAASNQINIGNVFFKGSANNNIGIGLTNPTTALNVQANGNSNYRGIMVQNSVSDATNKGAVAIVGPRKTNANLPFTGLGLWDDGTDRSLSMGGGTWQMPNATLIAFYTAPTYSETNDTGVERMRISPAGNVGIGTTNPVSAKLHVVGGASNGIYVDSVGGSAITAAVNNTSSALIGSNYGSGWGVLCNAGMCGGVSAWNNISDIRFKERIKSVESTRGLEAINLLRPVVYHWKDKNQDKHQGQKIGFIAQEIEKIFPELVSTDPKTGFKSLSYAELTSPIVKAIQDLSKLVTSLFDMFKTQSREIASVKTETNEKFLKLEAENEKLKKENAEIKARLDRIEKALKK